MYIPVVASVREVLFYLNAELTNAHFDRTVYDPGWFDHGITIDEFLADIFTHFQVHYQQFQGPQARWLTLGVTFPHHTQEHITEVLREAFNLTMQVINDLVPDYISGTKDVLYIYEGGESLLLYVRYDRHRYPHIPSGLLVPESAVHHTAG